MKNVTKQLALCQELRLENLVQEGNRALNYKKLEAFSLRDGLKPTMLLTMKLREY